MSAPDSITVQVLNDLTTVTVEPVETINSVAVNTVPEVDIVTIQDQSLVSNITIDDNQENLTIELSLVDTTSPVQSVNGMTGHVLLDLQYEDIEQSDPVNHVKYVHTQASISSSWVINHNLGFFPNVTVLDNSNRMLETYVQYDNVNTATIIMNSAASGKAFLT
jgi:hypothetical protein